MNGKVLKIGDVAKRNVKTITRSVKIIIDERSGGVVDAPKSGPKLIEVMG